MKCTFNELMTALYIKSIAKCLKEKGMQPPKELPLQLPWSYRTPQFGKGKTEYGNWIGKWTALFSVESDLQISLQKCRETVFSFLDYRMLLIQKFCNFLLPNELYFSNLLFGDDGALMFTNVAGCQSMLKLGGANVKRIIPYSMSDNNIHMTTLLTYNKEFTCFSTSNRVSI